MIFLFRENRTKKPHYILASEIKRRRKSKKEKCFLTTQQPATTAYAYTEDFCRINVRCDKIGENKRRKRGRKNVEVWSSVITVITRARALISRKGLGVQIYMYGYAKRRANSLSSPSKTVGWLRRAQNSRKKRAKRWTYSSTSRAENSMGHMKIGVCYNIKK